jgi:hypothetical protein
VAVLCRGPHRRATVSTGFNAIYPRPGIRATEREKMLEGVPTVESVPAGCQGSTESYVRGTVTILQARHPRPPPSIASGETRVDLKVESASANLPLLRTTRRLDASCLVSDVAQERMQVAVC